MKKDVSQAKEEKESQSETEEAVEKDEAAPETIPEASEEPSAIEKGEAILKGIDEGLKKYEEVTARMEKAAARMLLGGKAAVGEPSKTAEEKEIEKEDAEVSDTLKRF